MATTSISITPQFGNNTVTAINCGTSSPRLSGTVDISAFPSLSSFVCVANDITAVSGYANNGNLKFFRINDNKVAGAIPSISDMTSVETFRCEANRFSGSIPNTLPNSLVDFRCQSNRLTGSIPDISSNSNLQIFLCHNDPFLAEGNQLTGNIPNLHPNLQYFYCQNQLGPTKITGPIPSLSSNTNLIQFLVNENNLTGSIPSLSGLANLQFFSVFGNQLTGSIPSLSTNSSLQYFYCHTNSLTDSIPELSSNTSLLDFRCQANNLTGSIPDLASNTQIRLFIAHDNELTGYDGGVFPDTLGEFRAENNLLTTNGVNSILSAFAEDSVTNGNFQLNASSFTAYPGYFNYNGNPTIESTFWYFGFGQGAIATAANPSACPWRPSVVDAAVTPSWIVVQGSGMINQNIILKDGTDYTLTFDLAGSPFDADDSQALVQIADGISEVLVGSVYPAASILKNNFTRFSLGFTARDPQPGRSWRIEIYNQPVTNSPSLLITNIQVVPVGKRKPSNANGITPGFNTCLLTLEGAGNAAPTGQGLLDKATLISRGWTVTTN